MQLHTVLTLTPGPRSHRERDRLSNVRLNDRMTEPHEEANIYPLHPPAVHQPHKKTNKGSMKEKNRGGVVLIYLSMDKEGMTSKRNLEE